VLGEGINRGKDREKGKVVRTKPGRTNFCAPLDISWLEEDNE
jgi:hypothetical protein